ncbi:hypothetical protein CHS0354_007760 [Potamilus streckersoni]|uniref:EF-hand domain-containing protein n=1 Tax=Potamilus streckersoni TaxID=2493646 RepID=A0AAE0RS46_9BIVA|nr:hypothetical protein CHS0354_007760 [Potamilus streckersoni]
MSNEEITSINSPKENDDRVLLESADISSSQSHMEGKDDVSLKTSHNSSSIDIPSPEFRGYLEDILHKEEITPCQSPVEGKDGVSLKSTDMSSSIEISSSDFRNYLDDILQKETTSCLSPIEGKDNVSMKPVVGSSSNQISNTESQNHIGDVPQKEITTFQSRMVCKVDVPKKSTDIPSTVNILNIQPLNNVNDILQNDDIAICQSSKEGKDDASLKSTNISSSTGISNTGIHNHLEKTLQIEEIIPCQSPMEGKDDVSLKSTDISSSVEISSTEFRNYLEDILQNTEKTPCQSPRKSNDSISVKSIIMSSSLENSSAKSRSHLKNALQNDEVAKCQSLKENRYDLFVEAVPLPCSKDVSTTQLNNYVQNLLQENSSDFLSSSTDGSIITSDFSEELLTEDSVSKLAGIQSILGREVHGKLKDKDIMQIEVPELTDRQHQADVYDRLRTSNGSVTWAGVRDCQYGEEMYDSQQAIRGIQDQESMSEIQHASEVFDSHHDRLNVFDVYDSNDRQRLAGISESQAALLVTQIMDDTRETDHVNYMFDIHHALPMVLASNDVTNRQRLAGISDSQTAVNVAYIRDVATDIRYIDKAIESHFFMKDQATLDRELNLRDSLTDTDSSRYRELCLQFSSTDDDFSSDDMTSDSTNSEISSMFLKAVLGLRDTSSSSISDSDQTVSQLRTSVITSDRQHLTGILDSEKDVPNITNEIPSIVHILDSQSAKPVVSAHGQGQNELQLEVDRKCSISQDKADEHRIKGTVIEHVLSSRTDEAETKKAEIQDQTVHVLRTAEKKSERETERKFIPRLSMTNDTLNRKTEQSRSIMSTGLSMSAPVLIGRRVKSKTGITDEADKMQRDGQGKENDVTAAKRKNGAIAERPPTQDEKTGEARNVKQDFDATVFSDFKAENLTEEQIQEFKVAFGMYDKDADGKIATTELRTIMRSLGMNPSKEDVKEIIQKLDIDGKY